MTRRAPTSLRGRFLLLVAGIYVAVGSIAALTFLQVTRGIVRRLGASYATQYASQQKTRILARIDREVVLAQKLVSSPLLKRWCLDEESPGLKELALEELESYRRLFADRSYFFVVGASRHYYFDDAAGEFRGRELQFTIREGDPTTAWYFAALEKIEGFALHVDNNPQLGVTKVWINAVVKDGGEKIGLGGSGLDLTEFLKEVVHSPEPGVETILVDGRGFVQGRSDVRLMEANARVRDEAQRLQVFSLVDGESGRDLLRQRLARLSSGKSAVETFEIGMGGRSVLAAAVYLREIDWTAIILVDPSQAVRSRQFLPILLLLAGAFLVTVFLVSWTLDALVLRRLARLQASTRDIAAGRYDLQLPVDRPDEIGKLTESFNVMSGMVQATTQNLEERVAGRTRELTAANALLEASSRKVMQSIETARLIQSSLLARPSDLRELLPDSFVYWRPRDVVGGDFYALYRDRGKGFLLAVADCTGHGVPGAFMTAAAKALLDRVVAERGLDAPAALLADLDRGVRSLLQQEGPGSQNGLDIALLLVGEGRRLRFAAARLPLWVQEADGTITVLKGDRRSLGYAGPDPGVAFTSTERVAAPGQRFFLLSDGILDQAGGEKGFGLGQRRLRDAFATWKNERMSRFPELLDDLLRDYQGTRPQRDDITLVGFRLDAAPPGQEGS